MTDATDHGLRYLALGDRAVCLGCPDRSFADTACDHLFLQTQFHGQVIATIRYTPDDDVENLLPGARKANVVYIDRTPSADGHARIVLGMFDRFTAVLDLHGNDIVVRYGSQAPVQTLLDDVLQAALQPVLDSLNGFILHGACMVRDGRALVLMGNSGAGKSTTAFNLIRYGFTGYADDAVLVTPDGDNLVVWPLTRKLSLRPLSFRLFAKQGIRLGRYQKVGDKYYYAQSTRSPGGAELAHICFLDLSGESATQIVSLSRERTLALLDADSRHFSFMGRDAAHRYARILADRVPAPLHARLGTDLEYQGTLFDNVFSGRDGAAIAPKPQRHGLSSRRRKSELIRRAWSQPNEEPLNELIPLLGDFDPSIFKLALGFFQTLPLAGITPLAAPKNDTAARTQDPAPWIRADQWAAGCRALVKQTGAEVFQRFIFSWLTSAPLLYPFLADQLAGDPHARSILEQAWQRRRGHLRQAGAASGPQIHLLDGQDPSRWATAAADPWWREIGAAHGGGIQLHVWMTGSGPAPDQRMLRKLANLPKGSTLSIVPMADSSTAISDAVAWIRMVSPCGIPASLSRRTPLCRIPTDQAEVLLNMGAFTDDDNPAPEGIHVYSHPGRRLPASDGCGTARPYAACSACVHYGLGLCRGGFYPTGKPEDSRSRVAKGSQ